MCYADALLVVSREIFRVKNIPWVTRSECTENTCKNKSYKYKFNPRTTCIRLCAAISPCISVAVFMSPPYVLCCWYKFKFYCLVVNLFVPFLLFRREQNKINCKQSVTVMKKGWSLSVCFFDLFVIPYRFVNHCCITSLTERWFYCQLIYLWK